MGRRWWVVPLTTALSSKSTGMARGSKRCTCLAFGTWGVPSEGTQPFVGVQVREGCSLAQPSLPAWERFSKSTRMDRATSNCTSSKGSPDGRSLESALVADPLQSAVGVLYGTTFNGGTADLGTIFALLVNPPLNITPVTSQTVSNQIALFWPSWALGYTLQGSTNPSSGTWQNVSNGIPVTGIQLPNPTNSPVYYRLVAPN